MCSDPSNDDAERYNKRELRAARSLRSFLRSLASTDILWRRLQRTPQLQQLPVLSVAIKNPRRERRHFAKTFHCSCALCVFRFALALRRRSHGCSNRSAGWHSDGLPLQSTAATSAVRCSANTFCMLLSTMEISQATARR